MAPRPVRCPWSPGWRNCLRIPLHPGTTSQAVYLMDLVQYAHRLERLELVVWCVAALLLVTMLLLFAVIARSLRRQVVLRDRKGAVRMVLGMDEADEPELVLWDRDAKSWTGIRCDLEGSPRLFAADRAGHVAMQVGILPGEVPGLMIRHKSDRDRVQLCLDDAGSPYLFVFGDEGTRRLAVGISPKREPAIVFFDRAGEERIGVGFEANGEPFIHVLDEHGNVVNRLHPAKSATPEN